MENVYVGIDAHKESNLFAHAFEGREDAKLIGRVSADLRTTEAAIRKFMKQHDLEKEQLHICYEAGPTGLNRSFVAISFGNYLYALLQGCWPGG